MFSSRKTAAPSTGYNLTRSLRFRSSASAYLNRTPASAGSRTTWTYSAWVKRGTLGSVQQLLMAGASGTDYTQLFFNSNDTLVLDNKASNVDAGRKHTSAVYRDPSAWYHIVAVFDTNNATANNRIILYVNGSRITSYSVDQNPSSAQTGEINNNVAHNISKNTLSSVQYIDGYMTEVNFIDGQALTPSSFGETSATTGVWQPIKYTGTYGTNGFYLPFTDNSALTTSSNAGLGKDFSGNSNYWTTNNISITSGSTYDSMTDVPTLTSATAANYAVLNPLNIDPANPTGTITNGNLNVSNTTSQALTFSTIGFTTGKYYFEYVLTTLPSTATSFTGVCTSPYAAANLRAYRYDTGQYFNGSAWVSYGATWTTNDVIGVAIDMTNQTIEFFKNGTSQGQQTSIGLTGLTIFPVLYMNSNNAASNINFGQRPFAYTPPTGFVALNTFNLPTPTIGATATTVANKYFDATTYTGTGSSLTVTNSGSMQPDWVWIKSRSVSSRNTIFDAVRGTNKVLWSDSTDAEGTANAGTGLTAFASNGFTLGTEIAGTSGSTNTNGITYVGWQWRASNATGVTNTSGSITSTVSANTTAGFSIVTWSGNSTIGATVGHGLGVAPSMIIVKQRTGVESWATYHTSLGATKYLDLNGTAAAATSISRWNNTAPSSSVITLYNDSVNNGSGSNYVAYCFAQVAGYSAFGSYTGNGSTDGPFVFLGFRPKFILIRRSDAAGGWKIYNTSGLNYNPINTSLETNDAGAEATSTNFNSDWLSNGFKLRTTYADFNTSGGTYIYMAFAEFPYKFSLAR